LLDEFQLRPWEMGRFTGREMRQLYAYLNAKMTARAEESRG
jgi:hypothetical protein